ncbi:hypothetical protein JYK14_07015 [Siccirubricoccus sp. KC 17139]|uniref:DUF4185 domain-containing protein n=1 Tax=Siccirubricoccus soli TaxID=2899147 RepID=A0ABT1D1X8_9PROT|nr:hypothetical protein [Siccirubricoccus soli]MCO6415927.1 hypothetical protein [Siccirubricoccus soli]MCP2682059.1 hypothetical protein [Siccirubricoccus soli]
MIPDSPVRAFRRADGQIALIAGTAQNWMLLGPSFPSVKPDCRGVMRRDRYNLLTPGKLWIQAVYTLDGQNIFGLASQDLQDEVVLQGCDTKGIRGRCWLNKIVGIQSSDLGNSYVPTGTAASFGDHYPSGQNDPYGAFSVSNIVYNAGYYYAFLYVRAAGRQVPGNCLLRSADVTDPTAWRAWDGAAFRYDPNGQEGSCKVVYPDPMGAVRSLQYVPAKRQWVALSSSRLRLEGDSAPVPGFYYSTSSDLLEWRALRRIMETPMSARVDSWDKIIHYPSLIDPESASRNFDTVDHDRALIFFSVHHLARGQGTLNRDIQYIPVELR